MADILHFTPAGTELLVEQMKVSQGILFCKTTINSSIIRELKMNFCITYNTYIIWSLMCMIYFWACVSWGSVWLCVCSYWNQSKNMIEFYVVLIHFHWVRIMKMMLDLSAVSCSQQKKTFITLKVNLLFHSNKNGIFVIINGSYKTSEGNFNYMWLFKSCVLVTTKNTV